MDHPTPLPRHGQGWVCEEFDQVIDGLVVDREVHVAPRGDILTHVAPAEECWCGPSIELAPNGITIAVHASCDGREIAEGHHS